MSKASDVPTIVFTLDLDSAYRDLTAAASLSGTFYPTQLLSLALGRKPFPGLKDIIQFSLLTEFFLDLSHKEDCIYSIVDLPWQNPNYQFTQPFLQDLFKQLHSVDLI